MVLEMPNNIMNSTDTCPCITDRHHERPRPVQLPARQRQRHQATVVPPGRAASREGEPKRGYQSPPQSNTKPPDSAERCEWLSAAMRRAGRLAGRPFSPCFTLVSRTFHARSLLPSGSQLPTPLKRSCFMTAITPQPWPPIVPTQTMERSCPGEKTSIWQELGTTLPGGYYIDNFWPTSTNKDILTCITLLNMRVKTTQYTPYANFRYSYEMSNLIIYEHIDLHIDTLFKFSETPRILSLSLIPGA